MNQWLYGGGGVSLLSITFRHLNVVGMRLFHIHLPAPLHCKQDSSRARFHGKIKPLSQGIWLDCWDLFNLAVAVAFDLNCFHYEEQKFATQDTYQTQHLCTGFRI